MSEMERIDRAADYVRDVLAEGNRKANAIANETLEQVRDAMGMCY